MDDRQDFLSERKARLARIKDNATLLKKSREFLLATVAAKYSYGFDWMGVPVIQYPQDLMAMQEIMWRVKPDLVIETGVARGGSVLFYASMMKLLGVNGRVVGIDVDIRPSNRDSIEGHPLGEFVALIEGSSIEAETIDKVASFASKARRIMVALDSHHSHDHVLRELELYSPFVKKGSYVVVFDTGIEFLPPDLIGDRPWGPGNSPSSAISSFLSSNDRFVVDDEMDAKLLISVAQSGYLNCVRD